MSAETVLAYTPEPVPTVRPALRLVLNAWPPSDVAASLRFALARARGITVETLALTHPTTDPRHTDHLVADLARARGTTPTIIRLGFGLPTHQETP